MFKRFVGITLASFGLGLWLFSAGSGTTSLQADEPQAEQGINALPQAIEAQPLATEAALKEQGIEIARRTVAKYRKIDNIAPARQRREF